MPKDEGTGLVEPDIVINGRALTFVQCMAVRVAIGSFRLSLHEASFRAGIGHALAENYDAHLAAVERVMFGPRT